MVAGAQFIGCGTPSELSQASGHTKKKVGMLEKFRQLQHAGS
jgi:hypothetical protein